MAALIIVSSLIFTNIRSQVMKCDTVGDICQCPSSITAETCILDCATTDSCTNKTLSCRQGDPCEIRCGSEDSCADSLDIEATKATNVKLICNGTNSCQSPISFHCGIGDCIISCIGTTSCPDFTLIDTSNANSFNCIGDCPSTIPTASNISTSTKYPLIEAVITGSPTMPPTQSPILLDESDTVSAFTLQDIELHPLYYIIATLLVFILIFCIIISVWVYKSHHQTQKVMLTQQRRLNSKSPKHSHLKPSGFNKYPRLKTPTLDIEYGSDNIMSPSPSMMATNNQAAPRMYRVKSGDLVKSHKKDSEESTDAETSISKSNGSALSSKNLREALILQLKAEEEKDGEETTARSSCDVFELMQHLMSINGHYSSQSRKEQEQESKSTDNDITISSLTAQHATKSRINASRSYGISSYNVPPPPPTISSYSNRNHNGNIAPPPGATGGYDNNPLHPDNMNVNNIDTRGQMMMDIPPPPPLYKNVMVANYHTMPAAFYGYAASMHHTQKLQHNHGNNSVNIPPPPATCHSNNTSFTQKMHHLIPSNIEMTETESRGSGISELSKHSASTVHIHTSDIDSGEEDVDETDINNGNNINNNDDSNDSNNNNNNNTISTDDYDTHTQDRTSIDTDNISSADQLSSHLSPHIMIQITPDAVDIHNMRKKPIIPYLEPGSTNINSNNNDKIKDVVSIPIKIDHDDNDNDDDKNNDDNMDDIDDDMDDNKFAEIEIAKEDSKTFKSYTMELEEHSKTPIPNEYTDIIHGDNNNDNNNHLNIDNGEDDDDDDNNDNDQRRRSYAIQLIGGKEEEESTLTDVRSNSTVIEDTYLKYLNM